MNFVLKASPFSLRNTILVTRNSFTTLKYESIVDYKSGSQTVVREDLQGGTRIGTLSVFLHKNTFMYHMPCFSFALYFFLTLCQSLVHHPCYSSHRTTPFNSPLSLIYDWGLQLMMQILIISTSVTKFHQQAMCKVFTIRAATSWYFLGEKWL